MTTTTSTRLMKIKTMGFSLLARNESEKTPVKNNKNCLRGHRLASNPDMNYIGMSSLTS